LTSFIVCVDEGVALSERRSRVVWDAVTELATELLPERAKVLEKWHTHHVVDEKELAAWLEASFRVRDYKPTPRIDLSRFYTGIGYDLEGVAKALGVSLREAAIYLRKMEKALMLMACAEISGALRHSLTSKHVIELKDRL
jgi:hypothetical protein